MQARSIEVAKKFGVVIHVRSSLENKKGTLIKDRASASMEAPVVSGIAYDGNEAKLSLVDIPDQPGAAAQIFGSLAQDNINVDMIIQSTAANGLNDISFTVPRTDLRRAIVILESVKKKLGAKEIQTDEDIAKVAIVGVGMRSHPGVAAKMFKTFADAGINIDLISTSEIKVACVVQEDEGKRAVKLLHKAFNLEKARS
jgi:aspartate kinase